MPEFSSASLLKLRTCHEDLQRLFRAVILDRDCTIVCGFRTKEAQDLAYNGGFSKLPWPKGKHNHLPSLAIDVIPYPFIDADWTNEALWKEFSELVKCKAEELGIKIVWGGDWEWKDVDHFQLV